MEEDGPSETGVRFHPGCFYYYIVLFASQPFFWCGKTSGFGVPESIPLHVLRAGDVRGMDPWIALNFPGWHWIHRDTADPSWARPQQEAPLVLPDLQH